MGMEGAAAATGNLRKTRNVVAVTPAPVPFRRGFAGKKLSSTHTRLTKQPFLPAWQIFPAKDGGGWGSSPITLNHDNIFFFVVLNCGWFFLVCDGTNTWPCLVLAVLGRRRLHRSRANAMSHHAGRSSLGRHTKKKEEKP